MKLNRKGYMLVEIIISFALAMVIAFYLLNLTYKFKNTNEDIYMSTIYLKDKEVITKNIMNDLERGVVREFREVNDGEYVFMIAMGDVVEDRKLLIKNTDNGTIIEYGKINGSNFDTSDVSYFYKTTEKSLKYKEVKYDSSGNIVRITIRFESLYSNQVYDIKLISKNIFG